jgi:hypothetical protein
LHEVQSGFQQDLGFGAYPFARLIGELPGLKLSVGFLDSLSFYNYHNYEHFKEVNYTGGNPGEEGVREESAQGKLVLTVKEYKNCLTLQFSVSPSILRRIDGPGIRDLYFSILRQIAGHSKWAISQMKETKMEEINAL